MKKQKQARSLHHQFNNLEEQHKIKTNITIPKFHYSSIPAVQQKARSQTTHQYCNKTQREFRSHGHKLELKNLKHHNPFTFQLPFKSLSVTSFLLITTQEAFQPFSSTVSMLLSYLLSMYTLFNYLSRYAYDFFFNNVLGVLIV